MAHNTLDMSLVKVVIGSRTLKALMEIQRTDDGEKATYSDPDLNGNVTKYKKKNNMATFDITVRNGSDDMDYLEAMYKNGSEKTFTYADLRKAGVNRGGSGLSCSIDATAGNGVEDDPTYTITIPDYQQK